MPRKYYKVVSQTGSPIGGGSGRWHLPKGSKGARWMPAIIGKLRLCWKGYHVFSRGNAICWIFTCYHPKVFGVQVGKERVGDCSKVAVRHARLLRLVFDWELATNKEQDELCRLQEDFQYNYDLTKDKADRFKQEFAKIIFNQNPYKRMRERANATRTS